MLLQARVPTNSKPQVKRHASGDEPGADVRQFLKRFAVAEGSGGGDSGILIDLSEDVAPIFDRRRHPAWTAPATKQQGHGRAPQHGGGSDRGLCKV